MEYGIPILAMAAALWRAATLPGRKLIWLEVYLGVAALRAAALWMVGDPMNYWYGAVWLYSEPIMSVLWIGMAVELYAQVSALYPGLSRPGWATVALAISTAAMWATLVEDHTTWRMQYVFLMRRATSTVLAFAIGLLALLFGYFRNNIPPNLVRHAAIMAVYFTTQAIGFFGMNLTKTNGRWELIYVWGAAACYVAWALALMPGGEKRPALERHFTDEELATASDERLEALVDLAKDKG